MKRCLHIVTRSNDPLAQRILDEQRQDADLEVRVADLTGPEPDYRMLLAEIFAADSVAVW